MLLPTYVDCERGRRYSKRMGDNIVQMYKRQLIYVVSINGKKTGHMTYDNAIEHLIHLLRTEGIDDVRRGKEGGRNGRLQGSYHLD